METSDKPVTNKPVWLLNVSGTLFLRETKPVWGYARPQNARVLTHDGRFVPVRWSHRLVKEITDIYNNGLVDIWWATSWYKEIDKIEKMLGLPSFHRAFTSYRFGEFKDKQLVAKKVINSGRRLIWTDEIIMPKHGPFYDFLTSHGQGLLISPDVSKGLQPKDIVQIKEFIEMKEVS